jgi:hypothetical protein
VVIHLGENQNQADSKPFRGRPRLPVAIVDFIRDEPTPALLVTVGASSARGSKQLLKIIRVQSAKRITKRFALIL